MATGYRELSGPASRKESNPVNKLLITSIALMSAGVVGILFAVAMEIATNEPVYFLVMKLAAGLFGVGGPLLGWGIAKRGRKR